MSLFNRKPRQALVLTMLAMVLAIMTMTAVHAEPAMARVVAVTDSSAVDWTTVNAERVAAMVSRGIRALTGQPTDEAAWGSLVTAADVVGIKVNTQAAPLQVPRPALIEALVAGLQLAGVPAGHIVVWDLDGTDLHRAGYQPGTRYRVEPVKDPSGSHHWDEDLFFESKIVGKLIWGDHFHGKDDDDLSSRSHLPLVISQKCTKIINVAVFQDHKDYGLSGCLANLTVGAVDNNRRFGFPNPSRDSDMARLASLPMIRDKVVLHVMDALIAGYAGGPSFKSKYSWPHATVYFGRDPVAIDTVCLEILEQKRAAAKITAVGSRAGHVAAAGQAGLGVAERNRIDLVKTQP